MPALRPLDTRLKLYFCFALLCSMNTAIVLWILTQCSAPDWLTVAVRQKFSGAAEHIFTVRLSALLALGAGLVVSAGLALWLQRTVAGPAMLAMEIARQASTGNLDISDHSLKNNELISIMQEMNAFLSDIVAQTRAANLGVADGALEILRAGLDLSACADAQAAALAAGRTASASLCAAAAAQTSSVQQSRATLRAGCAALHESAASLAALRMEMGAIDSATRRIKDVHASIHAHALQANVLALSAALEAGRTGAASHGFAAIADQMRALAQQSACTARELKVLIDATLGRTAAASDLLARISRAHDDANLGAQRTLDCIDQLNSSAQQQAAAIMQLHETIETQEQAAMRDGARTRRAAQVAARLRDHAAALTRTLSVLKLGPDYPSAPLLHLAHSNPRHPPCAGHGAHRPAMAVVPSVAPGPKTAPVRAQAQVAGRDLDWEDQ